MEMSAVTASPYWTLLFVVFVSADQKIITAESGQDVTLTCRAPNNIIKFLHWSRRDLGDKYVLFYQQGHFVPDNQHPSFKNRVGLQDRQMKDGDVSLILKDVTINDAGTYVCRVYMEETNSWELISIIYLVVDPPERKTITAESGQDVTLTCRAPNNNIKFLHWSRDDLGDKHVLLYQDGHFDPDNQHPSFKNRMDLQDRQMKDGDVSLILKDVTINDTGTYECRVYMEETYLLKIPSIIYLVVVPADQKIITAESGQDITLTCRAPNSNIRGVVWSRTDKPGFVFLHQDGHFVPDHQHPSFKNRVDLQDRQMKDGDVSLILKDVTTDDTGTYLCNVLTQRTGSLKLISIIYLRVPAGILGEFPVWMVALIVCVVLLLGTLLFLIFIFLIYTKIQEQRIKHRKQVGRSAGFSKLDSESPPAVPRSHSYPTRRKKDDQGQKETDDADLHLQSP